MKLSSIEHLVSGEASSGLAKSFALMPNLKHLDLKELHVSGEFFSSLIHNATDIKVFHKLVLPSNFVTLLYNVIRVSSKLNFGLLKNTDESSPNTDTTVYVEIEIQNTDYNIQLHDFTSKYS